MIKILEVKLDIDGEEVLIKGESLGAIQKLIEALSSSKQITYIPVYPTYTPEIVYVYTTGETDNTADQFTWTVPGKFY